MVMSIICVFPQSYSNIPYGDGWQLMVLFVLEGNINGTIFNLLLIFVNN